MDRLTSDIPGLEVNFTQEESALKSILGTDEAPVVVEVRGEELDEIEVDCKPGKRKNDGGEWFV